MAIFWASMAKNLFLVILTKIYRYLSHQWSKGAQENLKERKENTNTPQKFYYAFIEQSRSEQQFQPLASCASKQLSRGRREHSLQKLSNSYDYASMRHHSLINELEFVFIISEFKFLYITTFN